MDECESVSVSNSDNCYRYYRYDSIESGVISGLITTYRASSEIQIPYMGFLVSRQIDGMLARRQD